MRRKREVLLLLSAALLVAALASPAYAGDYVKNMAGAWTRGVTNVATSPLEIFITLDKYHKGEMGTKIKGVNYIQGLVHGTGKALIRAGSGVWDIVAGIIPGHQDGMPLDPETLV